MGEHSSEGLIDVAVRGAGVVYMLDVLVRSAISSGMLRPLLPEWTTSNRPIFLVHPQKRYIPAKVRVFSAFVRELFASLS